MQCISFLLKDLTSRAKKQTLKADFEAYLDGFSPNVKEILEKFKFRNQIDTMIEADILGAVIEKFVSSDINLSPNPIYKDEEKTILKHPGLDNHGMGTIFEELIRRFNEENNEEAGEHWTPRDVVELMADLIFMPIADQIKDATKLKAAVLKKVRPFITEKDPIAKPIDSEPDVDLRDTENIPFTYEGGIDAFIQNEVLTYAPDAWVDEKKTQIGYEISFTKYFYKPVELRKLSDILQNLKELETEADGLLAEVMEGVQ